jgi:NADH pyrophosphatase NudC (nudix superfamily)
MTDKEAMKLALDALDIAQGLLADARSYHQPKMLAAYTAIKQALAQRTEQNFCSRCGKRTSDIHTCTPPKENA